MGNAKEEGRNTQRGRSPATTEARSWYSFCTQSGGYYNAGEYTTGVQLILAFVSVCHCVPQEGREASCRQSMQADHGQHSERTMEQIPSRLCQLATILISVVVQGGAVLPSDGAHLDGLNRVGQYAGDRPARRHELASFDAPVTEIKMVCDYHVWADLDHRVQQIR
jgi:hypothetical protein